jgi:tetratricopeptide (TPR) repeat protein
VAKSKHFVIYANDNPKILLDFATKLERFDQGARLLIGMQDPPVGDGNRLTVFVMPKQKDVAELMGDKSGFFDGFYTGRVAGSLAYIKSRSEDGDDYAQELLFHEYTHHLMAEEVDRPFPEWFVEGFAEFLSTAKFDRDGSVLFGVPLNMRADTIFNGPKIPFGTLSEGLTARLSNDQKDAFYARGWLLTHYLETSPKRKGQLSAYFNALASGVQPLQAAQQAFGDLKQLDRELDDYRTQKMNEYRIPGSRIQLGPINVDPLSPGGAEVILIRAKIKNGVERNATEGVAAQLRDIERRFPGDELVESTLAEAELDAGHAQAALAAAERALKAAPRDTEAMVLKGRAIEENAKNEHGEQRAGSFDTARQAFVAANKIDTEDPEPLFEFYWSYISQGIEPNENAIAALHYASDLAPQDYGVRMNSAIAYLYEGKPKEARSALAVVAYSPHAEGAAETAKAMIAKIDAGDTRGALSVADAASQRQAGAQ